MIWSRGFRPSWPYLAGDGTKKQKGFSLIELLIVVTIILIIAAIAIPNLLRAKMAANEASAVGSLRTITTAQATYSSMYSVGYARTLAALGSPAAGLPTNTCTQAGLIDPVLTGGNKSGYNFADFAGITANGTVPAAIPPGCADGAAAWTLAPVPVTCDTTGHRTFFLDQTGVIRFSAAAACPAATVASAPLQ